MGQGFLTLQCSGAKPSCLAMLVHTSLLGTPQHTGTHLWVSRFPPLSHTTLSILQTTRGANVLSASLCPCASPPYLAPVLVQSGLQLQGQLQKPMLHLDKAGVRDRLGLCLQQHHNTRAMPCTLGNAGGGSDWNDNYCKAPNLWHTLRNSVQLRFNAAGKDIVDIIQALQHYY